MRCAGRGWTISAIADTWAGTARPSAPHLNDERVAGERKPAEADPFRARSSTTSARLERGPASVGGDVVRARSLRWATTGPIRRSPS